MDVMKLWKSSPLFGNIVFLHPFSFTLQPLFTHFSFLPGSVFFHYLGLCLCLSPSWQSKTKSSCKSTSSFQKVLCASNEIKWPECVWILLLSSECVDFTCFESTSFFKKGWIQFFFSQKQRIIAFFFTIFFCFCFTNLLEIKGNIKKGEKNNYNSDFK